jgi:oligopeptide/dipeptide ABC transporter ATP-binding protein
MTDLASSETDRRLLDVSGLSVTLSTKRGELEAVSDVSLTIDAGAAVGLVGESGCGKSLTALAIAGLLPTGATVRGRLSLEDVDLMGLDPKSRRRLGGRSIGMIFQDPVASLNPVMSIGAQLREGARFHLGLSKKAARELSNEMLERVGIPPSRNLLSDYAHQLSGGMCQRVSIAIALLARPKLLLADEPTTALDVSVQAQILELLGDVVLGQEAALLLISHDLGVVAQTCEQIHVMYAGQIVESGTTDDVLNSPTHPYTAALLSSVPEPNRTGDRLRSVAGSVPQLEEMPVGCRFAARCEFADEQCATPPPWVERGPSGGARCWHPLEIGQAGR